MVRTSIDRDYCGTLSGTTSWYWNHGQIFGPLTLLWFLSIGGFGLWSIIQTPTVLAMVNPYWAYHFVVDQPFVAFLTMGAVILTMTGGEAIYADMGHFGRLPIRLAWFIIVLPCLLLNYAGQGALLLRRPEALENPFICCFRNGAYIQ